MLKRLRVKFIALNMLSVFVVVSVALCGVCFIEHQRNLDTAREVLGGAIMKAAGIEKGEHEDTHIELPDAAALPAGESEAFAATVEEPTIGEGGDAETTDGATDETTTYNAPQIGGAENGKYSVPVAVYLLADDGTLTSASPYATSASISDDVAASVGTELLSIEDGMATLGQYNLTYMKRTMGDGVYVSFVDSGIVEQWQSLAFTLVLAGIGVMLAFFVVSFFFARWALRPVEEAWTAQKQFVTDASHELKTPLTIILANASILTKHPEKTIGEQSQWIESTQEEALRMQELVGDMLTLAQAENIEAAELVKVDLSDLVSKEVLQFESVAFERGIEINDAVAEGICVNGDSRKLEKLVGTLVDNACKYGEEGTSVSVKLASDAKRALLSVNNAGHPIDAEDIDHIFDRFYRADKARTRDQGSFGLGLAIAREIAESHGGSISAKSSAVEGTTFTVSLPLAK